MVGGRLWDTGLLALRGSRPGLLIAGRPLGVGLLTGVFAGRLIGRVRPARCLIAGGRLWSVRLLAGGLLLVRLLLVGRLLSG